jgi:hypothetical protein
MKAAYSFLFLMFFYSCTSEIKKADQTTSVKADTATYVPDKATISAAKQDTTVPYSISTMGLVDQGIKYKGNPIEAWKWYDKNGQNILLISMSKRIVKDMADESSAELFACHYLIKEKPELLWDMYDAQWNCPFDLTAEFVGSPEITDLDNNGIMESFITYRLACRSDVSPAKMKIIVHQGKQKYGLRGYSILKVNDFPDSLFSEDRELDLSKVPANNGDLMQTWGRYENTDDFKNTPKAFLEYARELWSRNFVETIN